MENKDYEAEYIVQTPKKQYNNKYVVVANWKLDNGMYPHYMNDSIENDYSDIKFFACFFKEAKTYDSIEEAVKAFNNHKRCTDDFKDLEDIRVEKITFDNEVCCILS